MRIVGAIVMLPAATIRSENDVLAPFDNLPFWDGDSRTGFGDAHPHDS